MPISNGIISRHALPQPDDLVKSKVLLQLGFNAFFVQARVPAGVQQTLLGADESPGTEARSNAVSRSSLGHAVSREAPLSPTHACMHNT